MIHYPVRFFGQHGEDFILWNFFGKKTEGFFVDVGAFDGVYLSNSYLFEQQGWQGICIEPHPRYFPLCRENRPKTLCLQNACVEEKERGNVLFTAEKYGLLSSISHDEKYYETLKEKYETRGISFDEVERVTVKAETLDRILETHLPEGVTIDFVSIDVEGFEEGVLKGFDLEKYDPTVLVVEANDTLHEERIVEYLRERNYHLARKTGVNLFFTRERWVKRLAEIPLRCVIEKQVHPLGPEYTIPEYLEGLVLDDERRRLIEEKEAHIQKQAHNARILEEKLSSMQKQMRGVQISLREKEEKIASLFSRLRAMEIESKEGKERVASLYEETRELRIALREKEEKISELFSRLRASQVALKEKEEHIRK
ncbi:FkbM family methyltransferase, partial [Hydrogenimonas sp.]